MDDKVHPPKKRKRSFKDISCPQLTPEPTPGMSAGPEPTEQCMILGSTAHKHLLETVLKADFELVPPAVVIKAIQKFGSCYTRAHEFLEDAMQHSGSQNQRQEDDKYLTLNWPDNTVETVCLLKHNQKEGANGAGTSKAGGADHTMIGGVQMTQEELQLKRGQTLGLMRAKLIIADETQRNDSQPMSITDGCLLMNAREEIKRHAAQRKLQQIKAVTHEELCCDICRDYVTLPTLLGCSHCFCGLCLERWRDYRLVCPTCRTPIQFMVKNLPLQRYLDRFMELQPESVNNEYKRTKELRRRELEILLWTRQYTNAHQHFVEAEESEYGEEEAGAEEEEYVSGEESSPAEYYHAPQAGAPLNQAPTSNQGQNQASGVDELSSVEQFHLWGSFEDSTDDE